MSGTPGARLVKCVVWDIDNTLIDGVYLESGGTPPAANPAATAVLAEFAARGILQAIASRNPPEAAVHAARAVPAWQRRTQGELRWPITVTTAVAVALQMALPDRLVLVHPFWVLPAVQGGLIAVLAPDGERVAGPPGSGTAG